MYSSRSRKKKQVFGVAHETGNGKAEKAFPAAIQGMFVPPDEDKSDIVGDLFSGLRKITNWSTETVRNFFRHVPSRDIEGISDLIWERTHIDFVEFLKEPEPSQEDAALIIKFLNDTYQYSYDNPLSAIVPAELLEDLPEDDTEKFEELFERFKDYPFVYTGSPGDGVQGFIRKSGDCNTLTEMFLYAAHAAGLHNVVREKKEQRILVNPGEIHGRNAVGNTLGKPMWFFYDHFWCSFNGQHYDLLFRRRGYPQISPGEESMQHERVHFMRFQNNHCIIQSAFFPKLHLEEVQGITGIAFESVDDTIEFINREIVR